MDYSDLVRELQNASLFDLYRLRHGIDNILDQPEKLQQVKNQLNHRMEISYFSCKKNRLINAVVEKINRTWVSARDREDGKLWNIPLSAINIGSVNTDIHPRQGQSRLEKNHLKVGESIGFLDKENREMYGKILQLNQKTATILTSEGARWRVAYGLLFKIVDAKGYQESEIGLIEGEIIAK